MLLDALFHCREGSAGPPLKNVMSKDVAMNYRIKTDDRECSQMLQVIELSLHSTHLQENSKLLSNIVANTMPYG
jgi:hypothetical protein